MVTSVAVLGSSGSIGTQTLDVIRSEPERYRVAVLAVANSVDLLCEQAVEFQPDVVAVANPDSASEVKEHLPSHTELLCGADAFALASQCADIVINGVVGFAGLPVTLAALEAGKRLGLANKESLIAAGPLVQRAWLTQGAELLPIDSEHCALHQCLRTSHMWSNQRPSQSLAEVAELVLTASGGPFRGYSADQLAEVKIADALAHPTWQMGPKITVDSSTLMNKGLEVIEAHELFGVSYGQIRVVVHPQSMVHSMVSFSDGSTMAQLSRPDMRLCIGYALTYPRRASVSFGAIDWSEAIDLEFTPVDFAAFRCLSLAYEAGRAGGTAPAWLSAANEVAVEGFLGGLIPWCSIAVVVDEVMQGWTGERASDVEVVLEADREARELAKVVVGRVRL